MNSSSWYLQLRKPYWSPPSWIFGPIWTFLYILIVVSFVKLLFLFFQNKLPFIVLLLFILNIIFNLSFTYFQFKLKSNFLAAIDIMLVWVTLVGAIIAIYPYVEWLAYLQIPYLLWVSFATILQLSITYLNK